MSGHSRSYKFGPKNNWRRAVWNDVLAREPELCLTGRNILYLAGPEDWDRHVATQKGVHPQNLIAIDRSRDNVSGVKRGGYPALHADALSVLQSWPVSRPVQAVMMDFCCGLEQSVLIRLSDALHREPFRVSVVMANFMRGRDASSSELRDVSCETAQFALARYPPKLGCDIARSSKNRAAMFFAVHSATIIIPAERYFRTTPSEHLTVCNSIADLLNPSFYSYRSGSLVFDSVVFRNLSPLHWPNTGADVESVFTRSQDQGLKRRISAALAIRTARLRGVV